MKDKILVGGPSLSGFPQHSLLPYLNFLNYLNFLRPSNKPARVSLSCLTIPKYKGGIGIPDMQRFYWACHMTRIVDWQTQTQYKR